MRTSSTLLAIVLAGGLLTSAAVSSQGPDLAPPSDLRPLLAARQSEMRLVQARYALDRGTLAGNYLGGMRPMGGAGTGAGGGGRGGSGGASPNPPAAPNPEVRAMPANVPVSPNRIARLKRFDLDWQAALAKVDAPRLSAEGKADLERLNAAVANNLSLLDADAVALAQVSPFVPFALSIVQLVEARIRLEDVNAEKAAGVLGDVTRQIGGMTARLEAGLSGGAGAMRAVKAEATGAAAATDLLRNSLVEWFQFYNGYDPLFTWWMGVPFKRVDAALQAYSTLLRDKVATADTSTVAEAGPGRGVAAVPGHAAERGSSSPAAIAPSAPPRYPSVPDLAELIALPQDEMTPVVQKFRAAIGRGGRGGAGAAPGAPAREAPAPDRAFYEGWLSALHTVDFDALTRNAQIDYLFIRTTAEQQLARFGAPLPPNPPRKSDASGIPGPARGRQGLVSDLQDEFVPYTPEELIAIGERQFAWCELEMTKASREMGLGDDWKRALETVKEIHPPPGGQVAVVRDLMFEAVDYLRAKDLLTVPSVAAESLRMIMMTPERQLVNPFFTGGSLISVSYPHDSMDYEARIQSMRGNNTPFSHATAFHEMIPGHNLVFYTGSRFAGFRPSLAGGSPFYGEGWPLYWELLLYDQGFHDTPEKRVGALFWRMHRCARIVFSLKFHMGEWSPQECIDYLVDRVGFERDNATAEVRRSFQGGYGPLYQAAYLLGGLQLRALRRELVDGGQMTGKQFHDEVLRQGSMPIAFLRLAIGRQKLTRDMKVDWRFDGEDRKAGALRHDRFPTGVGQSSSFAATASHR